MNNYTIYDETQFFNKHQLYLFISEANKYSNGVYSYTEYKTLNDLNPNYERIYFIPSHCDEYYMKSKVDIYSPAYYLQFNADKFLNRSGIFIPMWYTKDINKYIETEKLDSDYIFIKPNSGKKEFDGQTFSIKEDIYHILESYGISDDFMLFISDFKKIKDYEYRFYIIDNKISTYSNTNIIDNYCPNKLINFVNNIVKNSKFCYGEDGNYVIDIAIDSENNYWIDEINSIFYSEFYKFTDIKKLISDFFINK